MSIVAGITVSQRHTAGLAGGAAPLPATRLAAAPRRRRSGLRVAASVQVAPSTTTAAPSYTTVDLPPLAKDFIPASAGLPDAAFDAPRKADAIVLAPQGVQPGASVPAVLFCHGFSQPPTNYLSTLKLFAEQGWLVIAPTTSILDIAFSSVETTGGWRAKPPAKLQTALILDTLRSAQYLYRQQQEYKISNVLVCGHSMGGAGAIVAASKLKDLVTGVGVMAPAVKQTVKTEVNPGLSMGNKQTSAAAIGFFRDDYPNVAPLHILGGTRDMIVPEKEVQGLYDAAYAGDQSGDLMLYWLPGSHIGFEDDVNLEVNIGLPQRILFGIINFLLYRLEITKLITGDFSEQRQAAQAVLLDAFKGALAGEGTDGIVERETVKVAPKPGSVQLEELAAGAQENGADAPWVLPTALLLGYSALHAASLSEGAGLLSSYGSDLSQFSALGLGAATFIAAGLVYENAILAAGRFITAEGTKNLDLLDALNDPRFFFHSAAPLLCLTGLDLGQRLGVGWASNPWVEGGVAAACAVVVALSTLRNTLLLQTRPTWSAGILHFTFNDAGFDFTRIIPVALTTLLLTALGVSATLQDASNWAFAAGPAACLALSAGLIPRSVAPMILTGNGGEALLIASLMATEAALLGQKFL